MSISTISRMRPGPRAHDADRVCQEDCLIDVVRDERDRTAMALPQLCQEALCPGSRERIQRPEGLVHEQHLRVVRERSRDRHTLLHATRELFRIGIGEPLEAHLLDQRAREVAALGTSDALELRPELDVPAHAHPRVEGVRLEHHAAVGARPIDRMPIDEHLTRGRLDEARHDVEQGGFAAPGGAHEAGEMRVRDLERDVLQGLQRAPSGLERHRDVAGLQRAHRSTRST